MRLSTKVSSPTAIAPLGRLLEAGDAVQRGGLPAAAGPEEGEELAVLDGEVTSCRTVLSPNCLVEVG